VERHALIAGISGIIGRHLAEELLAAEGWSVTGISRHAHDLPKGVKHTGRERSRPRGRQRPSRHRNWRSGIGAPGVP